MEIKISTTKLQDALARVSKGASCNKMLAITSVVTIETSGEDLILKTTDGNIVLQETIKGVVNSGNAFLAATSVTLFTALVNKTTSKEITLDVTDNTIRYVGNGVNSLPLILDEDGNVVEIEAPLLPMDAPIETISSKDIEIISQNNVLTVSADLDAKELGYYYLHNGKAITYNRRNLCVSNIQYQGEALISAQLLNLLGLMDGNITFARSQDGVLYNFICKDTLITGNFNNYTYEIESGLLKVNASPEFNSEIVIKKEDLKESLDRISLFVEDQGFLPIKLISKQDGLQIESINQDACELVEYSTNEIKQQTNLEQLIDLKALSAVINVCGDNVKIVYGIRDGLKIVTNTSEFIICYIFLR